MKVLTTGGSGFAGKHVLRRLVKEGFDVINLVNKTYSEVEGVKEIKIESYESGFFENILSGVDTVVHLAAALGFKKENYEYFYKTNVVFPGNLASAAAKSGVRKFIYISSAGVYGKGSKIPITEEFPPSPVDKYEKTKFMGEKEVLKLKDKLNVIIIRPGWIYGPGDRRTFKLYRAINSGKFFIAGKGDGKQSPIFVEDFVNSILLLLKKEGLSSGEIFNIAGEELITTERMVKIIADSLNKKILPFKIPLLPLIFISYILDFISNISGISFPLTRSSLVFFERSKPLSIEKAKSILGYTPLTTFEEGVKKAVNWYKTKGML